MTPLQLTRELLGISAYDPPAPQAAEAEARAKQMRKAIGGRIQNLPQTRPRWLMADLEAAIIEADQGLMRLPGQLSRSMKRDGMIGGLRRTRTAGLVALPKIFRGSTRMAKALQATNSTRSLFDEMLPPAELALIADDGEVVGIGIGELVPVPGREHPILIRLEPEFLQYRMSENRWYFNGAAGPEPIIPGDGRWVLHVPGGRQHPWQHGLWHSLGRAFIIKEHAMLARNNYSGKLANPARVAVNPQGAGEDQRLSFFRRLMNWGLNTVFMLPSGWDVRILESNGRGYQVFKDEIETSNNESMIAIAGQVVTVTGGSGFANANIHATIRADLIKATADALAHTINTQVLPQWAVARYALTSLPNDLPRVEWDIADPAARRREVEAFGLFADAVPKLSAALNGAGLALDVAELVNRFGVPLLTGAKGGGKVQLRPEEMAGAVTVDEARESAGLPPLEGEEGDRLLVPAEAGAPAGDSEPSESPSRT